MRVVKRFYFLLAFSEIIQVDIGQWRGSDKEYGASNGPVDNLVKVEWVIKENFGMAKSWSGHLLDF